MKLLAILAIAVLAASHISAQTESVIKTKATDALTESIVIPSGKSVTIASGATITAASGSTVTGFGGTPAWGDITSKPANVTAFGDLANASGVLTNNGSGTLSYTALGTIATQNANAVTLTGGTLSGMASLGLLSTGPSPSLLTLDSGGMTSAGTIHITATGSARNLDMNGSLAVYNSAIIRANASNSDVTLPISGTLVGSADTGTVTSTMLAGSITASKVNVASQAQAEAGSDTTTLMTPQRTAQAIAALAGGGGGGKILQVIYAAKTDTATGTNTTFADITGLSVSITPSTTGSRVLIFADLSVGVESGVFTAWRIARGGVAVLQGDDGTSRQRVQKSYHSVPATSSSNSLTMIAVDSPATTSSTTYTVQAFTQNASYAWFVNRSATDANTDAYPRGASCLIAVEIGE